MRASMVPCEVAGKHSKAGMICPSAKVSILNRPAVPSSTSLASRWADPCITSRLVGQVVDMRHWTFGCAMTFGASTTAAAVIAASVPPAVTRNLRRSLVTWASSLRFDQGRIAARQGNAGHARVVNASLSSDKGERGAAIISPWLLPVLERHVVGADQLVAARLPDHPLVRAVEVDLLVERDGRDLLDP